MSASPSLSPVPQSLRVPLGPPRTPENLRVWLAHDWLTGMRGGEKVLLELVRMFPLARIAVLFQIPGSVDPLLTQRVGRTSALQEVPGIAKVYRHLLPVLPLAAKTLSVPACDLVISSSHCVAKGLRIPRGTPHLCYCHSPMRYIWGMEEQYLPQRFSPQRLALNLCKPMLRRADLRSNASVTRFLANSQHIAARIRNAYGCEAHVVHPNVDTEFFTPATDAPGDFYLVVSALVPYKRVDLAVRAIAAEGTNRKLVIIGKGPLEQELRRLAGPALGKAITFLGWQNDEAVRWHYQHCRALLFPGEEDFGMVPVEVQACGRPVIALDKGGVRETVVPLQLDAGGHASNPGQATGVFFAEPTVGGLQDALARFERHETAFTPACLRAQAERFNAQHFRAGIWQHVEALLAAKGHGASEPVA